MGDVANYPITGPPKSGITTLGDAGPVPLRIEIYDMKADKDMWNLYMLGLQSFYDTPTKSDLSYYEIAGIHGMPNREWGGVKPTALEAKTSKWGGYCCHTSILFASWHRPHLSLYEQVLYEHIQRIAASFPESSRARYQRCANHFRIPYWDWARPPPAGQTNFPTFVGSERTVKVITPTSDGKEVEIHNPLYSYVQKAAEFNQIPGDFVMLSAAPSARFDCWLETLRYPTPSQFEPKAVSNDEEPFKALANAYQSFRTNLMLLFMDPNYKDYAAFTNHQWDPKSTGEGDESKYASIEDVHNQIHALIGGNKGHMAALDYAAYEPAFWLHHTNIDRLFAIWQGINPTSYTIDKPAGDGTCVNPSTMQYLISTNLTPFYDHTGQAYWDSEGVRNTHNLNYAYPETQKWNFKTESEYTRSLTSSVIDLYGINFKELLAAQIPNEKIPKPTNGVAVPVQKHHLAGKPYGGRRGAGVGKVIENLTGENGPFALSGGGKGTVVKEAGVTTAEPAVGNPLQGIAQGVLGLAKDVGLVGGKSQPTHSHLPSVRASTSSSPAPTPTTTLASTPVTGPTVTTSTPVTTTAGITSYTEYIANIKVLKHTLNDGFKVHCFLGEIAEADSGHWHADPTLSGSVVVFGKDATTTGCEKCVQDAVNDVTVTGTVPLTVGLLEIWKSATNTTLRSLLKEDVLPWLKTNLHWRVAGVDGGEHDREAVEGLKVSVVTTEVSVPEGAKIPVYSGVYTVQTAVTEGRPAGFGVGDSV